MRRSKRPGRSSAGSRISGRLVAPRTITFVPGSKPSISVRIWLSVCSRSSLPPLMPPYVARARAPDRVQLVDEDDRRRRLLRLLEEVAHARGAHAHDRLDELRGRDVEEGGVRLAGDRAGQQRLAGPGRPVEQDAVRDARAELRVALRVLQEIDDLDQLVLGLVDPGDVVEGDPLLLVRLAPPCGGAAEAAEDAASSSPAHLPPDEPDEEADQQDRREEAEDHCAEDATGRSRADSR